MKPSTEFEDSLNIAVAALHRYREAFPSELIHHHVVNALREINLARESQIMLDLTPRAEKARAEDIDEAIKDSLTTAHMDGEGEASAEHLTRELAAHGLVIVDAGTYGSMKLAIELIMSAALALERHQK